MNYAEFWVLERAVDGGIYLCMTTGSRRYLQEQWNRPAHNLAAREMAELLHTLEARGDIFLECANQVVKPSLHEVEQAVVSRLSNRDREGSLAYWLTPQGGARWETFAAANWDRYYAFEWLDDQTVTVAATTPEVAERAYHHTLVSHSALPNPEKKETFVKRPWQATYWKVLPEGHEIRFACEPVECISGEGEVVRDLAWSLESAFFQSWYRRHPNLPPPDRP